MHICIYTDKQAKNTTVTRNELEKKVERLFLVNTPLLRAFEREKKTGTFPRPNSIFKFYNPSLRNGDLLLGTHTHTYSPRSNVEYDGLFRVTKRENV